MAQRDKSDFWERTAVLKKDGGSIGDLLEIATLGVLPNKTYYEVEYTNRVNNLKVRGVAETLAQADADAQSKIPGRQRDLHH